MNKQLFLIISFFLLPSLSAIKKNYVLLVDDPASRKALNKTFAEVIGDFITRDQQKLFIEPTSSRLEKDFIYLPVYTADSAAKINKIITDLKKQNHLFHIILVNPEAKGIVEAMKTLLTGLENIDQSTYMICTMAQGKISKGCFNVLKKKLEIFDEVYGFHEIERNI